MNCERKTALVLGGTAPHAIMTKQLKERGYYVILVDYLNDPPAKKYADEHIMKSTLDKDAIVEIALSSKASLIISGCVDQANVTACYAMEKLGLIPPYSYENALKTTNKALIKEILRMNEIPTPGFKIVEQLCDLNNIELLYPLVVKPVDSTSAKGISKVEKEDDLTAAFNVAKQISRDGRVIIEEFVEGKEVSAYFFIDDKANLLLVSERCCKINERGEVHCIALCSPANISKQVYMQIESIGNQIAKAFNLKYTPMFFQGIIVDETIQVLELSARVAGSTAYYTIKKQIGFDIISAVIDSYEGKKNKVKKISNVSNVSISCMLYAFDGIFSSIEGLEELISEGIINEFIYFKNIGNKICNDTPNGGRIGAAILEAPNEENLKKKIKEMLKELEIYDESGNPIMQKHLYVSLIS